MEPHLRQKPTGGSTMNFQKARMPRIALITVMVGSVQADPIPQPEVLFSKGFGNTWHADWPGIYGRTYFSQGGTNLETWQYLPLIEFSDGDKSIGGDVEGTPKYFFRLHHTDLPTTHPDLEDFADDGIGSMIKVMMGLNPFTPLAWLDVDGDGIHDAIEQFWFGNLTATGGGTNDDADGNGIRDIFEIQAGEDPATDQTADPASRTNYLYDSMGRLTGADIVTYHFDIEGNLESATTPAPPEYVPPPEETPPEVPPGEDPPPEDPPFPF
jgi:hypothetical protein